MTAVDVETSIDIKFDHDMVCETVWHAQYGWEEEKAQYVIDAFLPTCRHATHNVLIGQRCVDHLLDNLAWRCQECGSVGQYMFVINPL